MIGEILEKRSAQFIGAALIIILGVGIYLIGGTTKTIRMKSQAFYTTDDGQTIFADALDKLPPFDHNGQTAYGVCMFSCDGGKTKFAGYLERYTLAAKSRIQAQNAALKAGTSHAPALRGPDDIEVKKPGSGNPWLSRSNPFAEQIVNIKCPDGADCNIVLP